MKNKLKLAIASVALFGLLLMVAPNAVPEASAQCSECITDGSGGGPWYDGNPTYVVRVDYYDYRPYGGGLWVRRELNNGSVIWDCYSCY